MSCIASCIDTCIASVVAFKVSREVLLIYADSIVDRLYGSMLRMITAFMLRTDTHE